MSTLTAPAAIPSVHAGRSRRPAVALLTDAAHYCGRHVRGLIRQPAFLMITLFQPVIWLLLFGQLFKRVVDIPGFAVDSYIAFLTPGVIVMTALFSSGWSGMGFIIDMERGVLNRLLATPTPRGALIAGNLLYGAVTLLVQSVIILGIGLIGGARYPGGVLVFGVFEVGVLLLAAAFASLSNALALLLRSQESVIGVAQLLVLPLSFLSSVLMPVNLLPAWMRHVAAANPVNWAVTVGRQALAEDVDWGLVGIRLGWLAVLALVVGYLSTRAFRSYQRSV
jgi:ABC-2 type transport system permease protein